MSDKIVHEVEDVLCMAVPDGMDPDSQEVAMLVYTAAIRYVHRQYADIPKKERPRIRFRRIDTLITDDLNEAETFQPVHGCQECKEGAARTRAYLRMNPGHAVALANIYYQEIPA